MKWFKLYPEMIDDPKLRLLAFEDRWHYVALLCCKAEGLQDEVEGLWEELLRVKLGLAQAEFDSLKKRLGRASLVGEEGNTRGGGGGGGGGGPKAAERQRKYREKQRKRGDKPHLVRQHIPFLQERDGTDCVYCGEPDANHVDHVMPLSLNGSHTPQNLVLSCKACNSGKGGRTPEDADMAIVFGALRGSNGEVTATSQVEVEEEVEEELKDRQKRKRFVPPTLDEVSARCQEMGYGIDPDRFWNFYESQGWKVGKNPMKDWHKALAGWQSREGKKTSRKSDFVDDLTDTSWAY